MDKRHNQKDEGEDMNINEVYEKYKHLEIDLLNNKRPFETGDYAKGLISEILYDLWKIIKDCKEKCPFNKPLERLIPKLNFTERELERMNRNEDD